MSKLTFSLEIDWTQEKVTKYTLDIFLHYKEKRTY